MWLVLVLAGCGQSTQNPENLTLLAGSELEDLKPFLPTIEQAAKVKLTVRYGGTLGIAEQIDQGEPADLAWLSQSKYISLLDKAGKRIVAQEKIMLSPVVLGVKESLARRFGWIDHPEVTWRDIADQSASGELRYAMTDPASSNTGFSALLGVAAAFSGSADALSPESVDHSALTRFFQGQRLTAGSSGWLVDAYLQSELQLDGLINYESVLMQLNASQRLREKLVLIYPKEGIITADYPLMLLNPAQRPAYERLVTYLKSPEFQQWVMQNTQRRPAIPQVHLGVEFPKNVLVELPFPSTRDTVDRILMAYLDRYRRPSHVFFVLDLSGSMSGLRLTMLQEALNNLTGLDASLTGRFARFRSREEITMIPFDGRVREDRTFTIGNPDPHSPEMVQIREFINGLEANGATALYDAVSAAYRKAADSISRDPERFYSVVLMSDGERNGGISGDEFAAFYNTLPANVQSVKTFTILFGDASPKEMEGLSQLTQGRVFDGRKSLTQAFKTIRGYQ
jgi:Ca-activated chloride channel family protein